MIKRKILFLKSGSFSEINKNVYNFLTEEFPDCSVEIYDTKAKDINFLYYIKNFYFFIIEYGLDILLGKKSWKEAPIWFFATSYVSTVINQKIQKAHKNRPRQINFILALMRRSLCVQKDLFNV
jgi:hypothetical protein